MKSHLAQLLQSLTGPYFAPSMGLLYMSAKLMIRHILHKFAEHVYDFWGTMAWFGVDVILLASSLSIAIRVPEKMKLGYEASVFFYIIILLCFLGTCACYTFFTKRRNLLNGARPHRDFRLFLYLSVNWFLGFAWFWAIIDSVRA
jgi:hypothetical protein